VHHTGITRGLRTGAGDGGAYLEITNSGPVIPDDAVPSLFEPFRRMEARTGVRDGVGLGLSIARSVIAAHHATVTARSQPAGGLDISVVIPRRLAAPQRAHRLTGGAVDDHSHESYNRGARGLAGPP
jgi:signal transduction histidine kinase